MNKSIHQLDRAANNRSITQALGLIKEVIDHRGHIRQMATNGRLTLLRCHPDFPKKIAAAGRIKSADADTLPWRIKGQRFMKNGAGIDLATSLLKMAAIFRYKIFLLGASVESVKNLADSCEEIYGRDMIAGYCYGDYEPSLDKYIADAIVRSGAQILLVDMPAARRKNFLHQQRISLSQISFIMEDGGSFDILSGKVKRVPAWIAEMGLGWFWKTILEPRRLLWRQARANIQSLCLMLRYRISIKKYN